MKIRNQNTNMSIDDFELITVIGTGSYGKVVLGMKKDSGKVYAIKALKKRDLIEKN
jgi:serine/threonine protein kinase